MIHGLNGMEFIFIAIGISIIVRAVRGGGGRWRNLPQPQQPVMLEDPRVPQLQNEVEDLRMQVERLTSAERFYAQLQAPQAQGTAAAAEPAAVPQPSQVPAS